MKSRRRVEIVVETHQLTIYRRFGEHRNSSRPEESQGHEMGININTAGVHHVALRSADFDRSKHFYTETLGFKVALDAPNIFIFFAGATAIAVRGPEANTNEDEVFCPFRVGLDHVALACNDEGELARVAAALSEAGVENTGVKLDETLGKRYVAFKDPDRIAWELYMT